MKFNCESDDATNAAKAIKLLLLDVDGILTDGSLYFSNSGEELKSFNSLDGHGIKMLSSIGIEVGIITGRSSTIVENRASNLGITLLYQGREDKLNALNEILDNSEYDLTQVCYAGDDLPDLPVLKAVGLSFSVPQAHGDIRTVVHAVTQAQGGHGAVREITDFLIKAQGKYEGFLDA